MKAQNNIWNLSNSLESTSLTSCTWKMTCKWCNWECMSLATQSAQYLGLVHKEWCTPPHWEGLTKTLASQASFIRHSSEKITERRKIQSNDRQALCEFFHWHGKLLSNASTNQLLCQRYHPWQFPKDCHVCQIISLKSGKMWSETSEKRAKFPNWNTFLDLLHTTSFHF